jgi:hypothetical protein
MTKKQLEAKVAELEVRIKFLEEERAKAYGWPILPIIPQWIPHQPIPPINPFPPLYKGNLNDNTHFYQGTQTASLEN